MILEIVFWLLVLSLIINIADGFWTLITEHDVRRSWKEEAMCCFIRAFILLFLIFGWLMGW